MYTFVKITGGPGRAFEEHCRDLGKEPRELIEAMVLNFVAEKNMPLPPPEDKGEGLDAYTATYVKMRDTRTALNKMAEKEAAAIKEQMDKIGAHLLKQLNEQGVQSMRTTTGTFYKQKILKPAFADDNLFYDWIATNGAFHFLERRITRKAVEDYMEEHGDPPPGVNVHLEYEVVVRKGKDK